MPKQNGSSAAKTEAETRRITKAAAARKKAAEDLADANAALGIDDNTELPPNEELIPEPSKLERILDDLNLDGSFEVSHEVGNESNKIGRWPLSDWPARMEKVAHMKGGGTFKILFRDERGVHKGQVLQTYDKDTYSEGLKTEATSGDPTARILEVMEKQNAAHRAEMSAMQSNNQAMLLKMIELSAGKKDDGNTTKDVLEMAKFLHDAKGPQKSPLSDLREVMSLINELRNEGEVQDASPMERLIGTALGAVKPLLDAGAARLAATAPDGDGNTPPISPAASGAAPVPAKVLPEIEGPTSTPAPASVNPEIAAYAQSLKVTIEGGTEPGIAAMMATASAPSKIEQIELLAFAKKTSVIEDVIKFDPTMAEYRDWLIIFFRTIAEELSLPPQKPEPEPEKEELSLPPQEPEPEPEKEVAVDDPTA